MQRPFHWRPQIICGVCDRPDPVQGSVGRQHDPRNIAIIGPRLQRFRPPVCHGQNSLPAQSSHIRQPFSVQRLCGQHDSTTFQHNRHTHAQIRTGTGQSFGDVGGKSHVSTPLICFNR